MIKHSQTCKKTWMRMPNNTNFSGLNIAKKKRLKSSKCKTFVEQQLKQQHLEPMSNSKPPQLEQQYMEPMSSSKPSQNKN
jgi:hypothetical protein